jgi:tRNA A37 threonylcarbamoyladenosine dehydratase
MENNSHVEPTMFDRTERLVGTDAMTRIATTRVILFGVGGVGGWCAESLVRSGIRHLTLVDCDIVNVTNLNRQVQATTETLGRLKVEVLRERLLTINPEAEIESIAEVYSAETADSFHLETYDFVIDAIDSLSPKAHLILHATSLPVTLLSSMGSALKLDPTKIRVAEFWKVQYCPLARSLRKKFKHWQQFPERKFQCVYSPEVLDNQVETPEEDGAPDEFHKVQTNGTVAHITAIFGFMLAGLLMEAISYEAQSGELNH